MRQLGSADDARQALAEVDYLADDDTAMAVFLAQMLGKPVLAEGPAGTGKTFLAQALAVATGAPLLRLQCYEGLDESRALFEWDYRKQLLSLQSEGSDWSSVRDSLFSSDFLLARPLLQAIVADEPVVLLIDEVDRVEMETEALLLEVLSEFQVTIPELGTIKAKHRPLVVLTSNDTRELSEALRRRCLYLHLDYPNESREAAIVESQVNGISSALARSVAAAAAEIRRIDLDKPLSVAESLDWARALQAGGAVAADADAVLRYSALLAKTSADRDRLYSHWDRRQS